MASIPNVLAGPILMNYSGMEVPIYSIVDILIPYSKNIATRSVISER